MNPAGMPTRPPSGIVTDIGRFWTPQLVWRSCSTSPVLIVWPTASQKERPWRRLTSRRSAQF